MALNGSGSDFFGVTIVSLHNYTLIKWLITFCSFCRITIIKDND